MDESISYSLEDFSYVEGFLKFNVIRTTIKKVPVRHVQRNYVKEVAEWKDSVRQAKVLSISKKIFLERFTEYELPELDIPEHIKLKVLSFLDHTPKWRQKQLDIQELNNEIGHWKSQFLKPRDFQTEANQLSGPYINQINLLRAKQNKLKLEPTSQKIMLWFVFLTIFTLGLIWLFYISSKKALKNVSTHQAFRNQINKMTTEMNNKTDLLKIEVAAFNQPIVEFNEKVAQKIVACEDKLCEVKAKNYVAIEADEDGFANLKEALKHIVPNEIEKGIYIIKNKTKNKYYVGQSKDVYRRLFRQHFNNGEVNNIVFAKDWYDGDEFAFKIFFVDTKDELDGMEKEFIEKYNSFNNGYNKTGGNV